MVERRHCCGDSPARTFPIETGGRDVDEPALKSAPVVPGQFSKGVQCVAWCGWFWRFGHLGCWFLVSGCGTWFYGPVTTGRCHRGTCRETEQLWWPPLLFLGITSPDPVPSPLRDVARQRVGGIGQPIASRRGVEALPAALSRMTVARLTPCWFARAVAGESGSLIAPVLSALLYSNP